MADQFAVPRRFADWREMLASGGLDAISICTPPSLHAEMAIAALETGYHVLVEKPIASTLDESEAMARAATASGRLLMVAHNQRFRTQHLIARDIIHSGRLGRVIRAHAVFGHGGPEVWSPEQKWYFRPELAGRGVLADLGYHKIDLLRWLLDQEVEQITGFGVTAAKPTTAEDNAVVALRFSGGTIATLHASWTHTPGVPDSVELACERGTVTVPSSPNDPVVVREQRAHETISERHETTTSDGPGWRATCRAFVEAIRTGGPSPVPASEGTATLRAVLNAYRAMGILTEQGEENEQSIS